MEVLVVILVIGLLIGLTIPAMASVRARAALTKSIANLHSLSLTMHAYHDRYGAYPYMNDAQVLTFTPTDQQPSLRVGISPAWDVERYWVCLMHDVAPWREHYQSWISPGLARDKGRAWLPPGSGPDASGTGIDPSYRLTNAVLATSATWSATREGDAAMGPQRDDSFTQPSAKVLMFDADAPFYPGGIGQGDSRPLLFADASSSAERDAKILPPVPNRLRSVPPRLYHDTRDGVKGRDR